jgi:hypothetical protein
MVGAQSAVLRKALHRAVTCVTIAAGLRDLGGLKRPKCTDHGGAHAVSEIAFYHDDQRYFRWRVPIADAARILASAVRQFAHDGRSLGPTMQDG